MTASLSRVMRRSKRKTIATSLPIAKEELLEEAAPPKLVRDYVTGEMISEEEMPVGSERWRASERAYWSGQGK